jgi:hypothetical protein
MNTYTFTYTRPDGFERTYTIQAENLTAALAIYRQRIKDDS